MKQKKYHPWFALSLIVVWALACSVLGGEEKPTQAPGLDASTSAISAQEGGGGGEQVLDTEFPLPTDVEGFQNMAQGDHAINFQTHMSIEETVAFYQNAFGKEGLTEETILTSIQEDGFSIVFRGSPNRKIIVVQGVNLGNDTTNVNIRYEEEN